jgi:hypothetical protein
VRHDISGNVSIIHLEQPFQNASIVLGRRIVIPEYFEPFVGKDTLVDEAPMSCDVTGSMLDYYPMPFIGELRS